MGRKGWETEYVPEYREWSEYSRRVLRVFLSLFRAFKAILLMGITGMLSIGLISFPFLLLFLAFGNSLPDLIGRSFEFILVHGLISALYAFLIVYFLRSLYWLRTWGEWFWNRHTPPFKNETPTKEPSEGGKTLEKSWNRFYRGLQLSAIFGMIVVPAIAVVILRLGDIGLLSQVIDYISGIAPEEAGSYFTQVAGQLPFVGEFVELYSSLPGEGVITIFYTSAALPLAFSIRNLAYIFEETSWYDDGIRTGIRYTMRATYAITATGLLAIVCIFLIATVLNL